MTGALNQRLRPLGHATVQFPLVDNCLFVPTGTNVTITHSLSSARESQSHNKQKGNSIEIKE